MFNLRETWCFVWHVEMFLYLLKTLFLQVLANINIYLLARFFKLTQFDDNSFSACIAKCYLTFRKQSVLAAFKICGKTFWKQCGKMVHIASLDEDSVFCLVCAKMPNVLKIVCFAAFYNYGQIYWKLSFASLTNFMETWCFGLNIC